MARYRHTEPDAEPDNDADDARRRRPRGGMRAALPPGTQGQMPPAGGGMQAMPIPSLGGGFGGIPPEMVASVAQAPRGGRIGGPPSGPIFAGGPAAAPRTGRPGGFGFNPGMVPIGVERTERDSPGYGQGPQIDPMVNKVISIINADQPAPEPPRGRPGWVTSRGARVPPPTPSMPPGGVGSGTLPPPVGVPYPVPHPGPGGINETAPGVGHPGPQGGPTTTSSNQDGGPYMGGPGGGGPLPGSGETLPGGGGSPYMGGPGAGGGMRPGIYRRPGPPTQNPEGVGLPQPNEAVAFQQYLRSKGQ